MTVAKCSVLFHVEQDMSINAIAKLTVIIGLCSAMAAQVCMDSYMAIDILNIFWRTAWLQKVILLQVGHYVSRETENRQYSYALLSYYVTIVNIIIIV